MVRPIRAGSSPPGYLAASIANTGKIRNSPSMRRAKIEASEKLARSSSGVILLATTGFPPAIGASTLDKTGFSHHVKPSNDGGNTTVSYTHLRAHETRHDLVC